MNRRLTLGAAWATVASVVLTTMPAGAQPEPAEPAPDQPEGAPEPKPDDTPLPSPDGPEMGGPDEPGEPEVPEDPLATTLAMHPDGLTAESVARLAVQTSPDVEERNAQLDAADAAVDRAFIGYFPEVTVRASYTRLSDVNNVTVLGPCPDDPSTACTLTLEELGDNQALLGAPNRTFLFLNRYSIVTSISVPVSDYFLRIPRADAAARHTKKAREYESRVQKMVVATNAKVALYAWVAAIGQRRVAELAIDQSKAHRDQAKDLVPAGLATHADVLTIEGQLAVTEQLYVEADAAVDVTAEQLRTFLELEPDAPLRIGFDIFDPNPLPPKPKLGTLYRRALKRRLELKALDQTRQSLREREAQTIAGYMPRLGVFANGYLANPNTRHIPTRAQWKPSWDAGVQLTWSLNETFTTAAAVAEAKANTRSVSARRRALERSIRIEVAQAYNDVKKATATIKAANRGVKVAEEAVRARELLFKAGEANAVDVIDAETALNQARFARVAAYVDYLVARARLRFAVGDVRLPRGKSTHSHKPTTYGPTQSRRRRPMPLSGAQKPWRHDG